MKIPSDILALYSVEDILTLIPRKSPNCGMVPNFDISAPTTFVKSEFSNVLESLNIKLIAVFVLLIMEIYEFKGQYHLELVYLYNSTKQTRMRQTRMRQTRMRQTRTRLRLRV